MLEFDVHALVARVRAGDPEALAEAYRLTFANEWGRLVLTDIAATGGVAQRYSGPTDQFSVGHHLGGQDLALEIIERAGFDQASALAMTLTGQLEGPDYEPSALPEAEPNPELPD